MVLQCRKTIQIFGSNHCSVVRRRSSVCVFLFVHYFICIAGQRWHVEVTGSTPLVRRFQSGSFRYGDPITDGLADTTCWATKSEYCHEDPRIAPLQTAPTRVHPAHGAIAPIPVSPAHISVYHSPGSDSRSPYTMRRQARHRQDPAHSPFDFMVRGNFPFFHKGSDQWLCFSSVTRPAA